MFFMQNSSHWLSLVKYAIIIRPVILDDPARLWQRLMINRLRPTNVSDCGSLRSHNLTLFVRLLTGWLSYSTSHTCYVLGRNRQYSLQSRYLELYTCLFHCRNCPCTVQYLVFEWFHCLHTCYVLGRNKQYTLQSRHMNQYTCLFHLHNLQMLDQLMKIRKLLIVRLHKLFSSHVSS